MEKSVYKLIYSCGQFYENETNCGVNDYVIVSEQDSYELVKVEALIVTTKEHIDRLAHGGKVVANSTETIRYFEDKKGEDRSI